MAPVNVTEQLPADRVQVLVLNEPPVVPGVRVKVTVPVGVFEAVVVSMTVATQVEVAPRATELGLQAMLVAVLSLPETVTVIVAAELVLVL